MGKRDFFYFYFLKSLLAKDNGETLLFTPRIKGRYFNPSQIQAGGRELYLQMPSTPW